MIGLLGVRRSLKSVVAELEAGLANGDIVIAKQLRWTIARSVEFEVYVETGNRAVAHELAERLETAQELFVVRSAFQIVELSKSILAGESFTLRLDNARRIVTLASELNSNASPQLREGVNRYHLKELLSRAQELSLAAEIPLALECSALAKAIGVLGIGLAQASRPSISEFLTEEFSHSGDPTGESKDLFYAVHECVGQLFEREFERMTILERLLSRAIAQGRLDDAASAAAH